MEKKFGEDLGSFLLSLLALAYCFLIRKLKLGGKDDDRRVGGGLVGKIGVGDLQFFFFFFFVILQKILL